MPCVSCMAGFHEECAEPVAIEGNAEWHSCCCWTDADVESASRSIDPQPLKDSIRQEKEADDLKDQTSTGRKRARAIIAAELASGVLYEDMLCEWAGLKYAGGGAVPIVGCEDTRITFAKGNGGRTANIQHGPDKSTLNNDRGSNLHVICTTCHNRWHAVNDPYYGERPDGGKPHIPLSGDVVPHDRETAADETDFKMDKLYWAMSSKRRATIEYRAWEHGNG